MRGLLAFAMRVARAAAWCVRRQATRAQSDVTRAAVAAVQDTQLRFARAAVREAIPVTICMHALILICALLLAEPRPLAESDPAARPPSAADMHERAIALSGLSKTYGCPGLRLGWLATRSPAVLAAVATAKDYTTICHAAPAEVLALAALRDGDALAAANRTTIAANTAAARAAFSGLQDAIEWHDPQGGSIVFPRCVMCVVCATAVRRRALT